MEENKLIDRIIENDEAAFRELYDTFSSRVYNTALGFLQSTEDAEDITQEIFILIHRSIKNFNRDSSLSTWIYRIAVNKSLEFIRSKKRKKRFAIVKSIFAKEEAEELPDFLHPGIIAENKDRAKILFKAIDKLTENQKTAFLLNKIDHLSYKEISEIMKVSHSSVESLIFRAKENLKKELYNYYNDKI
ncbi:MAG: RNA polymerase sigma factor [Ignavibacteriae bacterium]|nr:RNA polymerase sigma factor [Ignavibacteriota bacterium]